MNFSPTLLENLNQEQQKAVEAVDGPVLILAGAGTGKTRVLTTKIAYLIENGFAHPQDILAVTFTNKAAQEMRNRVNDFLGRSVEGLWLGTFHSIGARILRKHAEQLGLQSNFTILDTDDQLRIIKQILEAEQIEDKKKTSKYILSVINRWKDRGLRPENLTYSDKRGQEQIAQIYEDYQQRLLTLNSVDFGDLILHMLTLFKQEPTILSHYQNQFRYILVDEYQDTNVSQYLWLRLLASQHHNICCVGDDDQSIYGWRGAEVGNILRFDQDFQNAKVIRLEQNYRSTSHILGAASALISKNQERLGKTLWTDYEGGEKVIVRNTWDHHDEARLVGQMIEEEKLSNRSLSNMAILVRAGFQTRQFEERLLVMGIPYRVIGGMRFYERQEIRDALAYLRLVYQPNDSLAFERIINVPKRGVGTSTLNMIHIHARDHSLSMPAAALDLLEKDAYKPSLKRAFYDFFRNLTNWRKLLLSETPDNLMKIILEESGYIRMWQEDNSPDAATRLENLKELVQAIAEFDNIGGFLEHVSLVMDNNQNAHEDCVNIMTLHSAKGLEFDLVFLPGWEEGLFPHARSIDEKGEEGLEEERRLAYVGLTRAKKQVIITFCMNRQLPQGWQQAFPSRFLKELPKDHTMFIQATGRIENESYYGGGRQSYNNAKPKNPYSLNKPTQHYPTHSFRIGQQVTHPKFGEGVILSLDNDCLEIAFEDGSTKKIMADFVQSS